jgi:hypothetical protein
VSGLNKLTMEASGGAGGAATTSVTSSGMTTATSTTSVSTGSKSTSHSTTTTVTGTTVASTSTGALDLPPCGNVTDSCATLDATKWTAVSATDVGNEIRLTQSGYIELTQPSTYAECFVSIRIVNVNSNALLALEVDLMGNAPFNHESIGYDRPGGDVVSDPTPIAAPSAFQPSYLGIAMHAGKVALLYFDTSGAWKALGSSITAPAWLAGATTTTRISVDLSASAVGTNAVATFTDFNIKPIHVADLPP